MSDDPMLTAMLELGYRPYAEMPPEYKDEVE